MPDRNTRPEAVITNSTLILPSVLKPEKQDELDPTLADFRIIKTVCDDLIGAGLPRTGDARQLIRTVIYLYRMGLRDPDKLKTLAPIIT